MRRFPLRPRNARLLAYLLTVACMNGVLALVAPPSSAARRAPAASQAAETHFVRQLPVIAKDLVVDPVSQTIFASQPSAAGAAAGNSITPISPAAGAVGVPVFVGSEPGKMAISDDGKFIYVLLEGAAAIRRFDVATQTPGPQFSFGATDFDGPIIPREFAVQPGNPNTLAVFRSAGFSSSSAFAVYDDGVQRGAAASAGFFDTPTGLTFNTTDPSTFYVLGSSTLRRMTVSPSGVAQASSSSVTGSGAVKFDNGRLYTSSGHVLEPSTGGLLGTFTGPNMGIGTTPQFVPDSKAGRTFFLTTPSFSSGSTQTATLRAFDQQTFVSTGTLEIPGVVGTPTSLVRWGANGLAFATTGGQVFLIQTTLVPSAEPVPTPTPAPSPFPTPTPVPTPPVVPTFARQVAVTASDIVYNPHSGHIFASVPSAAGAGGNSITSVEPVAGTVGAPVFVGSEPGKMAISDNGQYIYVALDGAAAVRRYDINAGTPGLQFSLGTSTFFDGPYFVEDMEVMPGHAETVAVSRRNVCCSPRHEGVAVFDDGVQRPTTTADHTGSNVIEFSSADTLYGLNTETTEFGFRKMAVTASGVTVTRTTRSVVSTFGNNMELDAGRAYFSNGRVIDAETASLVGTFQNIGFGNIVIPDSSTGRTFFVSGVDQFGSSVSTVSIRVFDQQKFVQLGTMQVGGVRGSVRAAVRWGANGIAFATTGGQLFLAQSSLVSETNPAPTPTPTPPVTATPTPTPAPTPAAGELRQVALATNDLVVDPVTQTIFASVPGSAGAGGNSITPIDAAAGTAGPGVFVGSEPNKMAVSNDGKVIYVGIDGAGGVRRFDVPTRTASLQFTLGTATSGTLVARDLSVPPGQPGTVAVARRSTNSSGGAGTAVYDEGVQRPTTTTGFGNESTFIEFSSNPSVLYGFNADTSDFPLQKMAVAPCGVVPFKTVLRAMSSSFGADFEFENGVAYSGSGRSVDVETGTIRGTYNPLAQNSFPQFASLVAPDAKAGRVYFLVNENSSFFLRVFDLKTFLKIGELRLPGVTGTPSSLVRWGANGLAFRSTAGQVYLLQHSLIGGADPGFTPAPPPATPTFSAAGTVSAPGGGDPGGVTLSVTGSLTATLTTDAAGKFTVTGLPPCGGFTVTPSKPNYIFSPASLTVSNPAAPTELSFTAFLKTVGFNLNSVVASEGNSKVVVFVTRNTGTNEAATVSYETESGTASDRSDFNRTLGTVQFAPGEVSKGITILLGGDDTLAEGNETFTVKLKDPSGAALSPTLSTMTVTIIDNDAQQGAANPLQNARFFVARHYQDFLNRDAADDPQGWSFWADQISACNNQPEATKAACFADRHVNVSAAFFLSIEFQQTGYLAHRFYTASFPDSAARPKGLPRFSEFLRDTQELGRGVVVGRTGWEAQLEANKQAFALAWVGREEFLAAHPAGQPAGEYVDSLFQNSGATPTAAERAAAITAFGAGGAEGRARALRAVADSLSVYSRQFNSAFVLMQYFGYMRRAPNESPDDDFAGYQHWLDKLDSFSLPGEDVRNEAVVLTRIRRSEMVTAFLVSHEYMSRFGPANFDITK